MSNINFKHIYFLAYVTRYISYSKGRRFHTNHAQETPTDDDDLPRIYNVLIGKADN